MAISKIKAVPMITASKKRVAKPKPKVGCGGDCSSCSCKSVDKQPPSDGYMPTHGFISTDVTGEVTREMSIVKLANGSFGISIATVWQTDGKPTVTQLCLTEPAFTMLLEAMLHGAFHMDQYPLRK